MYDIHIYIWGRSGGRQRRQETYALKEAEEARSGRMPDICSERGECQTYALKEPAASSASGHTATTLSATLLLA
jgi:hypothetical protein